MKDIWNRLFKWLDHYRFTALGILLAVVVVVAGLALVGCESKTTSLVDPDREITRDQLRREVVAVDTEIRLERVEIEAASERLNEQITKYNDSLEAASADLDEQDAVKAAILEFAAQLALQGASGTLNPAALIPLGVGVLGSVLGIGSALDSRRKDKVITTLKSK